ASGSTATARRCPTFCSTSKLKSPSKSRARSHARRQNPARENVMKRTLLIVATLGLSLIGQGALHAQYPAQNLKFVVPFAAGSATDTLARLLGNRMATSLGKSILVENVAGGSGTIAAMQVVRATPDGYTVFVTSNTTHASNQSMLKKVPYDAIADFEP